jgi:hypothetical protein
MKTARCHMTHSSVQRFEPPQRRPKALPVRCSGPAGAMVMIPASPFGVAFRSRRSRPFASLTSDRLAGTMTKPASRSCNVKFAAMGSECAARPRRASSSWGREAPETLPQTPLRWQAPAAQARSGAHGLSSKVLFPCPPPPVLADRSELPHPATCRCQAAWGKRSASSGEISANGVDTPLCRLVGRRASLCSRPS